MFLTFGMLFHVLLLAGALWLVIKMGGRFSEDLARLRKKYQDYKSRGDPEILQRMQTEQRRRNYRETCVIEFRSEAITLCLLWALTLLAGLYALETLIGIIRAILSAL